jgi:ribonuclease HI
MLLTFGKYKNKTIQDVFKLDKQYINWLCSQEWFHENHSGLYKHSVEVIDKYKPVINDDKFIVYTDGACPNNGTSKARSSIGIHFSEKNTVKIEDVGSALNLTKHSNNYAEMSAIYESLCLIKEKDIQLPIELYTDSTYCRSILLEWYEKWVRNDLLHNKKNLTIIQKTYDIYKGFDNLKIIHVPAHTRNKDEHSYGNSIADQLARNALK